MFQFLVGGPGTAQAWSPLKADKTHHALAFFFVCFTFYLSFFLVRVSIFAFEIIFPTLNITYIHQK